MAINDNIVHQNNHMQIDQQDHSDKKGKKKASEGKLMQQAKEDKEYCSKIRQCDVEMYLSDTPKQILVETEGWASNLKTAKHCKKESIKSKQITILLHHIEYLVLRDGAAYLWDRSSVADWIEFLARTMGNKPIHPDGL
ncbi:hypothetical protein EDD18DRAFT_1106228 [Armillaria luteobubalina]|uniref:Uncharacterized protein n=1 Tax=Armillaria luteobubalina TaxID=153913 RepID=A0AA39Q3W6_9AGAR|nr:hypothetical protein EDD18DRAFT_1106228 [Armillaria luteobubalina]